MATKKASSSAPAFTHVEKVYYPKAGYTKGEMIQYYIEVAPYMLPHLEDRPVTLIRFPEGIHGQSFYEKNAAKFTPSWIKTFPVPRHEKDTFINYILINDVNTLAWCANLGAIEIHPFLHRSPKLNEPTHVAFDLDPGEGANLLTCIEVAMIVKDLLDRLGLQCFPKVSGSKGLQLYVPLNSPTSYEQTSPFAKAVAELLAQRHPDLIVSQMPKELRKKRVMIDWSQNSGSKTTVSVYSLRAKREEPYVSMPVTWPELHHAMKRKDVSDLSFSPSAALARLKKKGDLFAPVLTLKQSLPADPAHAPAASQGRLAKYRAIRDFEKTAEPAPAPPSKAAKGQHRFVIQKHEASHLHFDFRLEMEGALKSWAIPKGLPYVLNERHSAFEVEDHPIEYLKFEGTIPKGQYGGGTVMVWDIGTYEVVDGNYYGGSLRVRLSGKKLRDEWQLVRIRDDDGKRVWLISKAGKAMKPLSVRQEDASAITGRSMARIAQDNDAQWQSNRGADDQPAAFHDGGAKAAPEKKPVAYTALPPTKVKTLPEGPEWLYEIEWGGVRTLAIKEGDQVKLDSKQKPERSKKWVEIIQAVKDLGARSAVIDGEIVGLDQEGRPINGGAGSTKQKVAAWVFYAFDLLSLNDQDLRASPLTERREKLRSLVENSDVRFSDELKGSRETLATEVARLGLPGLLAKARSSIYKPDRQSKPWRVLLLKKSAVGRSRRSATKR